MKRIIFSAVILSFFSFAAEATITSEDHANPSFISQKPLPSVNTIRIKQESAGFFFKPYVSLEYSAPVISGGGPNVDFHTSHNLFSQIRDIENIAIGGNFRVHRYLGFNANWQQTELKNDRVQHVVAGLSRMAFFSMDQYNLSALFYAPVVTNFFEIFAEGGVSDMTSRINYTRADGSLFQNKAHETMGIYGAGFQLSFSEGTFLRMSLQKYSGKLALLDSHYSTVRIGYLQAF